MINFIYLLIFGLLIFTLSLIGYKKFHSTTLYALAIGAVVNANFFHAGFYPIDCFGLPFGIDSIIYTLFSFCIFVMYMRKGKKEALILSISSVIAIMISASFQLIATFLSKGSSYPMWQDFMSLFISSVSSLLGAFVGILFIDKFINRFNKYLLLVIFIVLISIINSGIFYPLSLIIYEVPENIFNSLLASLIGKIISICYCVLMYYLMNRIERKYLIE